VITSRRFHVLAVFALLCLSWERAFAQSYTSQPLATPTGFNSCDAYEANLNDVVVGSCSGPGLLRAVVWRNGVPQVLPLPGTYANSEGTGINLNGTAVGGCYDGSFTSQVASVWAPDGTVQVLSTPSGKRVSLWASTHQAWSLAR
jgi:uncharacterized membrane protein